MQSSTLPLALADAVLLQSILVRHVSQNHTFEERNLTKKGTCPQSHKDLSAFSNNFDLSGFDKEHFLTFVIFSENVASFYNVQWL